MKTLISMRNGIFLMLSMGLSVACNNAKPAHTPTTHVVEINNMQFQPAELTVNKGDTVMWINKDIVAHNATQNDSAWESPTLDTGDSWKKEINQSDSYYCSIHINMKASIVVE